MRLAKLQIQNLRSFLDQTIDFDDYTCFVGPNGAGKSCILTALNVFFRNTASASTNLHTLTEEDFHHLNVRDPVQITLTFTELSAEAQEDLKAYYRQEQLVVSAKAEWDEGTRTAEVKQYGSRLVMPQLAPFFRAAEQEARVPALREIYAAIRKEIPGLPDVTTKPAMTEALRSFEEGHLDLCELVESENLFYGWSRGENRLAKHVQWVHIPAVKDAATEQEEGTKTALGQLLQRTIRAKVDFKTPLLDLERRVEEEYSRILDQQQGALRELQESIGQRLRAWTTSSAALLLEWHYDRDKSVVLNEPAARIRIGDDPDFVGEVARLGHGMQRAFLVSILQELASQQGEGAPTLLLGFEEPELYQHPPQAQHISSLLQLLGQDRGKNAQVIVTSHSPYFVSGRSFESVRVVRKNIRKKHTEIKSAAYEKIARRLADGFGAPPRSTTSILATVDQILYPSQRELFFSPVVVLVEGVEDVAFLSTHIHLTGKWEDFRQLGCHFVVSGGKSNLCKLLAIARELEIPAFVVCDADSNEKDEKTRKEHEQHNRCILKLCAIDQASSLPQSTIWGGNLAMWASEMMDVVKNDVGTEAWEEAEDRVRVERGLVANVSRKNTLRIAAVLEELGLRGVKVPVLEEAADRILTYARSFQESPPNKPPGTEARRPAPSAE